MFLSRAAKRRKRPEEVGSPRGAVQGRPGALSRLAFAFLVAACLLSLAGCAILPTPLADLNTAAQLDCDLGSKSSDAACNAAAGSALCDSYEFGNLSYACVGHGCAPTPIYVDPLFTIFSFCNENKASVAVLEMLAAGTHMPPLTEVPPLEKPVSEYALSTANAEPGQIISGFDGNVWFVENGPGRLAFITPSGGITETLVGPYGTNTVSGIAFGNQGYGPGPTICLASILRTYQGSPEFDEIDCFQKSGTGSYFSNVHFNEAMIDAKTAGLAFGPDGYLWYTEAGTNGVGRFNLQTFDSQVVHIFPNNASTEKIASTVPNKVDAPATIIAGPDGAMWFTEVLGNRIGRAIVSGSVMNLTLFDLPTADSQPAGLAVGADGALWFTEFNANQIARLTPAGALTEYGLPTANAQPLGIAAGPDGALWFTEFNANQIGRISLFGGITEYAIPTPSSEPAGIVAGSDGNMWFTEFQGNKIGRLTVAPDTFISQSNCLFNWAEGIYPSFFAPAGAISNTLAPYYYRYYLQTNAYLGTSAADSHVYYLGPLSNYSILDAGALSGWLSTAGCP